MKICVAVVVVFLAIIVVRVDALTLPSLLERAQQVAQKDNITCTACVLGLTMLDDNILGREEEINKFLLSMCTLLQGEKRERCEYIINAFGVRLIQDLIDEHGPNKVCEKFSYCTTCFLKLPSALVHKRDHLEGKARFLGLLMDIAYISSKRSRDSATSQASEVANAPNPNELPGIDIDNDYFAPIPNTRRGSYWRGRDCNDLSKNVRPGLIDDSTGLVDNNCNGISGVNPVTRVPYEKELCSSSASSRRSVVTFGDSAAAAFAIPVEWLELQNLTAILPAALQELDWPEQSWSTGYQQYMNLSSVYHHLWSWNRCNHRDFQNLAKNGAKMVDFAKQIEVLKQSDYPLLGFVAYIGNDVCRRNLESMTKPEDFRVQLMEGLESYERSVKNGSSLLVSGLVDGRVLWDTMANLTHPLGCTYASLYEFLTCTDSNPCNTWLTPDELTRNLTSLRAAELSRVAEQVVNLTRNKWKNFSVGYHDFPAETVMNILTSLGGDPAELIEKVDGFHPSPKAQELTGRFLWLRIRQLWPEWVGRENPNNAKIEQLFGDQGGY